MFLAVWAMKMKTGIIGIYSKYSEIVWKGRLAKYDLQSSVTLEILDRQFNNIHDIDWLVGWLIVLF